MAGPLEIEPIPADNPFSIFVPHLRTISFSEFQKLPFRKGELEWLTESGYLVGGVHVVASKRREIPRIIEEEGGRYKDDRDVLGVWRWQQRRDEQLYLLSWSRVQRKGEKLSFGKTPQAVVVFDPPYDRFLINCSRDSAVKEAQEQRDDNKGMFQEAQQRVADIITLESIIRVQANTN